MNYRKGFLVIVVLLLAVVACDDASLKELDYFLPDSPVKVMVIDKWAYGTENQVCMAMVQLADATARVESEFPCELWSDIFVDQVCYYDHPTLTCGGVLVWEN